MRLRILCFVVLAFTVARVDAWASTDANHIQVYGLRPGEDAVVRLDGGLDEPAWRTAPAMGEFHFSRSRDTQSHRRQTVCRAFYTTDALYLAVECYESEMPEDLADLRGVVEIYLESGRTHSSFYKFAVRSHGAGSSFFVEDNSRYDNSWGLRSGFTFATARGTGSWNVEARIPFRAMTAQPKPGDLWVFNVRRYSYIKGFEDSSWSPGGSYDNPNQFGYIYFQPQEGLFHTATLLDLSRKRDGLCVEVIAPEGRMFVHSNGGLLDALLRQTRTRIENGKSLLARSSMSGTIREDLAGKMRALEKRLGGLQSQRGTGELEASRFGMLYLPAQKLSDEARQLAWDVRYQILHDQLMEDAR